MQLNASVFHKDKGEKNCISALGMPLTTMLGRKRHFKNVVFSVLALLPPPKKRLQSTFEVSKDGVLFLVKKSWPNQRTKEKKCLTTK